MTQLALDQERFQEDQTYRKEWEERVWEKLRDDPVFYFKNILKIKTKTGKIAPFVPTAQQLHVLNRVAELKREGKPIRLIILKPRQIGISTLVAGIMFWLATLWPNRNAKVIAHSQDSTEMLFRMHHLFYDYLPKEFKPMTKYATRKELVFENPKEENRGDNPGLRSSISLATAGRSTSTRGETIQLAHLSEVAFWEHAGDVATGLMQSFPPGQKDTVVIIESTANGVGNWFYDMYQKAEEGKNEFEAIFFPWHQFPEYSQDLSKTENQYVEDTMTPEEEDLKERFGLTNGNIMFRRNKIGSLSLTEGTEPEDLFRQEYPLTAEEAFIVKGKSAFNPTALLKNQPQNPLERRRVIDKRIWDKAWTYKERMIPKMEPHPHGELQIWEPPKRGHQYMIAADVATGERGGDFSCIQVIDKKTHTQVAEWHGKIDTDVFARTCVMIAMWYNNGTLAWETTGLGLAASQTIRDTGYPHVYVPKTYEKQIDTPLDRLGFYTSPRNKPIIIGNMARHIRQSTLEINSKGLWRECLEFRMNEKGQYEAPEGKNDDRVMAMAIGLQALIEYPYVDQAPEEKYFGINEQEQGDAMLIPPVKSQETYYEDDDGGLLE